MVNPAHNDNVHLSVVRKTFFFLTVSAFITAHLRKFTGNIKWFQKSFSLSTMACLMGRRYMIILLSSLWELISYLQLDFYVNHKRQTIGDSKSGRSVRTKACCPDLVSHTRSLNHYFSDRKYLPLDVFLPVKCISKMKWFLPGTALLIWAGAVFTLIYFM